jgi:hypothetical protein
LFSCEAEVIEGIRVRAAEEEGIASLNDWPPGLRQSALSKPQSYGGSRIIYLFAEQ